MPRDGVYVLEMNSGCFYVGSSEDIERRIIQHRNEPKFRDTHGGIYNEERSPLTDRQNNLRLWEQQETLSRMKEHGINRVRGWELIEEELSLMNLHLIETHFYGDFDLCRRCGFHGHYGSQCNTDVNRKAAWLCEIELLRMGLEEPVRRCEECSVDISSRPPSHTLCLSCWKELV